MLTVTGRRALYIKPVSLLAAGVLELCQTVTSLPTLTGGRKSEDRLEQQN